MQSFGQLYDCGESRNGEGYKDVTNSTDVEVAAVKQLMKKILVGQAGSGRDRRQTNQTQTSATTEKPKPGGGVSTPNQLGHD